MKPRLRLTALTSALLLVLLMAPACWGEKEQDSVTGQVVAVESRSITEFESLTIVDEDGETWEFVGGLFAGFTPSHLREHQALQEPVQVWFIEDGDRLRVTRIEDG